MKTHPDGSKADVWQTAWVGVAVMAPLPVMLVLFTYLAGPAGFFAVLLAVTWGALVGKHVVDALRDGIAAYGYAKADRAWTQK